MLSYSRSRCVTVCVAVSFAASLPLSAAPAPTTKKEKEENVVRLSPFHIDTGYLGATPGGAQDVRYLRDGAARGQIPHPNTFTAEGLFSEHDLPLELPGTDEGLFRVRSAAATARFEVLPEVRYLAQLGMSSGVRAETWQPARLNLVAVVDKSGSMQGAPLALVRASLGSALRHLRNGDQLSIVLYGDRAHVHLPPTIVSRATRRAIAAHIEAIESMGSTNLESGLRLGYEVARESKAAFKGNTRVMLFTDERPNVGNTAAEGFMAMARAASADGIGLTTIGVGVHFGAELATTISSVRGGNLFFFPNAEEMEKTFAADWDTLVTELAHDFSVRIEPAQGLRIAGVFGVPANLLRWEGGAIVMDVATIFLSRRKGAIYFALAPGQTQEDPSPENAGRRDGLAEVSFSYRNASDGERIEGRATCRFVPALEVQAGLRRGAALVDQHLTLKRAAQLHHFAHDQDGAFRLVSGLLGRLNAIRDRRLAPERDLVRELHDTLARLSGRAAAEPLPQERAAMRKRESDGLSGLPARDIIIENGLPVHADHH